MTKILFRLLIVLLTFLIGIVSTVLWNVLQQSLIPRQQIVISPSVEEENIAEAVFRYELESIEVPKVYFLSLYNNDPSDEFIKRFDRLIPRIKKKSQSAFIDNSCVIDKETNKLSGLLSVNRIIWISDSEVEVGGGYKDCEIRGNVYHVVREGNHWIVKSSETTMIS